MMDTELVDRAQRLADDVLFPRALATDRADRLAAEVLDALADGGFYGLLAPRELGGLAADPETAFAVIERLASGCLATTFTWLQHLGASVAVAASRAPVHDEFASALASGRCRAGVAFGHLRRPDPPQLTATQCDDGWRLHGSAPWVSGWGLVDVVHVGARTGSDVVWLLIDASESPTLQVERLRLSAIDASATVRADFADHVVASDRVVAREALADWQARDAIGLRPNGSLALGVAQRAARLLDDHAALRAIADARTRLDQASPALLPEARASASLLALQLATTLTVNGGGRSVLVDSHAQRLLREAAFLLVQGQTAAIRGAQLAQLRANRDSHEPVTDG